MIVYKDFDKWNEKKKDIETRSEALDVYEREIWWCSIGLNIGSEEDGKNELFERPALILRKFGNTTAWILPLTSKIKMTRYHYPLEHTSNELILSQLRLVSVKRLNRYIRKISTYELSMILGRLNDLTRLR